MATDFASESGDGHKGSKLREWSSFIGIITAVCGNILISFALNIQRYAHLRLEREFRRRNEPNLKKNDRIRQRNYGTQQNEVAEERARINLARSYSDRDDMGSGQSATRDGGIDVQDHTNKQDPAISLHSRRSSAASSEDLEKQAEGQSKKNYLRSPFWWLGLVLMTVGETGNFLAYGFAPASIVSPLGVVALISNCIIAPCLLKEKFRQRDFWGVIIAVAGAVVIVVSAKNSETKMGPQDIWIAITQWEFETYLGLTAALIIVLIWASGKYGGQSILIDLGLVGLFGGYTALSTKGVASLLSDSFWRVLTYPITYLLVLVLVLSALMQIRYINRALQHFDSTQVIPTQFVLFTISVIVGSAILYRDFKSATGARLGEFIGGCLLTFLGVYFITSGRRRSAEFENTAIGDEVEGPIKLIDEERYQDEVEPTDKNKRGSTASSQQVPKTPSRRSSRAQAKSMSPPPKSDRSYPTSGAISPQASPGLDPGDLISNPWQSADDIRPNRPANLEPVTSSPILPSEARHPHFTYESHEEAVDDHDLAPTPSLPETPSQAQRPSTLSRRSIAHFTPGPFMSPLSSPLSAVIADSIRKGVDSPTSASRYRRPRLAALRKSRSQRTGAESNEDLRTATTPLKGQHGVDDDEEEVDMPLSGKKGRNRSLSKTLGDFFRLKSERDKGKQSQSGSTADREAGGGGNE